MRKLAVLAAFGCLTAAGCMKLEQEVTLNDDGSSEVSLHYAVSEKAPDQLAALQGPGKAGLPGGASLPFDPQALAKQMETLQKSGGAAGPAAPGKSPRDEVEDMKKAARNDPGLKPPEKPKPEPGVEDYRKQVEDMKQKAADNPDLKPQPVERPAPPRREPPGGTAPARLTIKEVRSESKDGWQHTYVTASCRSLAAVGTLAGGTAAPREITLLRNAEGNYVLTLGGSSLSKSLPADVGAGDEADAPAAAQMLGAMKPLLAGFRMSVTYHLPGNVVETNAHETKGRTVSWVLDGESADFAKKAGKLGKEGLRVVFKGKGLDLPEIRPAAAPAGAATEKSDEK